MPYFGSGHFRLGAQHAAAGKHIVIGSRQPTPVATEVIRHQPEPLHSLRFHYPDGPETRWIVADREGSHATTIEFTRQWAEEEFGISPDEWTSGLPRVVHLRSLCLGRVPA